jgi:hypothetical protein
MPGADTRTCRRASMFCVCGGGWWVGDGPVDEHCAVTQAQQHTHQHARWGQHRTWPASSPARPEGAHPVHGKEVLGGSEQGQGHPSHVAALPCHHSVAQGAHLADPHGVAIQKCTLPLDRSEHLIPGSSMGEGGGRGTGYDRADRVEGEGVWGQVQARHLQHFASLRTPTHADTHSHTG